MSKKNQSVRGRPRKSSRWSADEKLRILLAANNLDENELGEFMRREGLHEIDLQEMRDAALAGLAPRKLSKGPTAEEKKIKYLQRELHRKEKALAEAAALLVLKKNYQALLEAEGNDTDSHNEEIF